jgi:hypothetical protein
MQFRTPTCRRATAAPRPKTARRGALWLIFVLLTAASLAIAGASSASADSSISTTASRRAAAGPCSTSAPATGSRRSANDLPASGAKMRSRKGSASGFDACKLLTAMKATSLRRKRYSGETSQTIVPGPDHARRMTQGDNDLIIIIYQPTSGVSFQMMASVLAGTATTSAPVGHIRGLGDKVRRTRRSNTQAAHLHPRRGRDSRRQLLWRLQIARLIIGVLPK